jgi:hypothetical protein
MHTYTPKLYIALKTKHRYILAAHAYKTFRTFGISNIHALRIYNIHDAPNFWKLMYVLHVLQIHALS